MSHSLIALFSYVCGLIKNIRNNNMRIVFMGTPDFAVGSLKALVEEGYDVVGVVTMPDKAIGKHHSKLQPSAVKQYVTSLAEDRRMPILQPERLKDESFISELRALNADLQIVVAFRMLPKEVWSMPPLGTFNLHASLLPQYRGAAPINWAIINGEHETGVTTFFLDKDIDTGRIILSRKISISDTDDAGSVHDRLMTIGAELVIETVDKIERDKGADAVPHETHADINLIHAPKLLTDTCRIDWTLPLHNIYDFIRGLSPYPAAWTELHTKDGEPVMMKIYQSEKLSGITIESQSFGSLITDGKTYLDVIVSGGRLRILSLQLAGKKRLSVREFLNGFKLPDGAMLV
jgi:methionyl-tRNA formyltransferase